MIEINGRFDSIKNMAFGILDLEYGVSVFQAGNRRLEMEMDASGGDSWGSTARVESTERTWKA